MFASSKFIDVKSQTQQLSYKQNVYSAYIKIALQNNRLIKKATEFAGLTHTGKN